MWGELAPPTAPRDAGRVCPTPMRRACQSCGGSRCDVDTRPAFRTACAMLDLLPSLGQDVGQAVELGRVGDGGQQDQVVAAGVLVAADEVLYGPGAGEVAGRDPGRE